MAANALSHKLPDRIGAGCGRSAIRETGARLPEPELHLARASLAAALGDTGSCDAALGKARQVLIEMGAPDRVESVEDELSG